VLLIGRSMDRLYCRVPFGRQRVSVLRRLSVSDGNNFIPLCLTGLLPASLWRKCKIGLAGKGPIRLKVERSRCPPAPLSSDRSPPRPRPTPSGRARPGLTRANPLLNLPLVLPAVLGSIIALLWLFNGVGLLKFPKGPRLRTTTLLCLPLIDGINRTVESLFSCPSLDPASPLKSCSSPSRHSLICSAFLGSWRLAHR
jgi:hypothetical protein